ncbi:hypothetical protein BS17DRAFT_794829 [Gyrodon lividus]|nr:hypothetical protein BS17DRAFT_794829 [Gyrodon lividus]
MLEYALKHRRAVDVVTQQRELGLRKFELSDNEWLVIEQLYSMLKILKDATLFFSRSTPNLVTVVPAMDHIDQQLTIVSLAKKTLNCYYLLTDSSEVYQIAMILHP